MRWGRLAVGVLLGGFAAIQLLPFDRPRTNPAIDNEVAWSSPETRALFMRACGDCHSNETVWPWYSGIAPVSWKVTGHVEYGRKTFNVSSWVDSRYAEEAAEVAETIREGSMPPSDYLRMHPEARLNPEESEALIEGLSLMDEFSEGGSESEPEP